MKELIRLKEEHEPILKKLSEELEAMYKQQYQLPQTKEDEEKEKELNQECDNWHRYYHKKIADLIPLLKNKPFSELEDHITNDDIVCLNYIYSIYRFHIKLLNDKNYIKMDYKTPFDTLSQDEKKEKFQNLQDNRKKKQYVVQRIAMLDSGITKDNISVPKPFTDDYANLISRIYNKWAKKRDEKKGK